jgi:hypothetical protein
VRTLSSAGGTLRATCTGQGQAQILSATPARSYKLENYDSGPAPAPNAAFRHGNTTLVMTVTCTDGEPSAATTSG